MSVRHPPDAQMVPGPALHLPRTLFGSGAMALLGDELCRAGVHRPLLVTDPGVAKAGLVARLASLLPPAIDLVVYEGVSENPVFADADRGAARYAATSRDSVIALGGGSVIDVAKYIALLASHGGTTADYAGVGNVQIGPTSALFAVPTTAGTGSEANGTAGIHPDAASIAVGVFSHHIMPRLVILDAELTVSLPPRLTAATGIDALSHCIEGYFSCDDTPFMNGMQTVRKRCSGFPAMPG